MTATDWAEVMTGAADEPLIYADWLEDQQLYAEAALARTLHDLADRVCERLEDWVGGKDGSGATHVEFRLAPPGDDVPHSFSLAFDGGRYRAMTPHFPHPACALAVRGAQEGGACGPAIRWLEAACGLAACQVWGADRRGARKVRMERRAT